MKTKRTVLILVAVLMLVMLAGCQRTNVYVPGGARQKEDKPAHETREPVTEHISAEEAVSIALAHAEVSKDAAKMLWSERDLDEKGLHYDVEFVFDSYEYDYEIDAVTGNILHSEREFDPPERFDLT